MDNFKQTIISIWVNKGFSVFREVILTSSLQQDNLEKVRKFLTNNGINNVDVSLVIPKENNTLSTNWVKYYDKSGQCISSLSEDFIPANTNNIKLTFCYYDEDDKNSNEVKIEYVINILRIVFGVPIARKLIIDRTFSNDKGEPRLHSKKDFASMFDNQLLNMFETPPIEHSKTINVPIESIILLDKAFSQTFPTERFILMWLAFESIVNTFTGSGNNGKKRENFFKKDLQSEIINNEAFRLFKVRCNMFKEGKFIETDIEKDCWILYSIIQISILEDCPQRKAFIIGLENKLSDS